MKYFLDTEFLEGTQPNKAKKELVGYIFATIFFLIMLTYYSIKFEPTQEIIIYSVSIIAFLLWGRNIYKSYKIIREKENPTIELISIGIVSEDGRELYEISKDFNLKEAWNRWQPRTGQGDRNNREPREYWIRENVLKSIFDDLLEFDKERIETQKRILGYAPKLNDSFTYKNLKRLLDSYGTSNDEIASKVKKFCGNDELHIAIKSQSISPNSSNIEKDIKFYAYYADYDWVVFCWLFGKMIDLPKGFPMYCIDLKQILDEKADKIRHNQRASSWSLKYAIKWIKEHKDYPENSNDHNALSDAYWGLKLYQFLDKNFGK